MGVGNGHPTGHVHLLGDHRAPQPTKAQREKQEVAAIEARVREISAEIAEHYMAQVPGLCVQIVGELLHANGYELKPPPQWSKVPAVAPDGTADQSGDAAVPTTDEGAEA